MSETNVPDKNFISELTAVIERNIANDNFGVSELAGEMNMSRSNLLRKVKRESKLSVSQLINQVRLKKAMDLLRKTSLNVSEVAHQVGFGSASYFIKCFREYYGYPPGEVGKREAELPADVMKIPESNVEELPSRKSTYGWIAAAALLLIISVGVYFLMGNKAQADPDEEKSIAVLPFKNDSGDSSNIYLINGLMESTLNKLQQIKDLRVISRTSVERYRNNPKSIQEMASELDVRYFVEGSGQKMGDRIVLNIQLIDAATDKHLWSRQYRRETKEIFDLQEEIARNISEEIEVFISPEEKSRIEKKPTEDLVAYDYFLKGRELFYRSGPDDLEQALPLFRKAIERDPNFSLAYASAAMVCYYLDIFNFNKVHSHTIDEYAEKALLYDSRSSESMIAKALSFAQKRQFELSVPYFEKALEYDPRSGLVLHFLTEFYNIYIPHPPKYLEYAIRKVKLDYGLDSATKAFNYFHLSNALMQNGFLNEALRYNEKSLQLNPSQFFAGFVNHYIHYAMDKDAKKAKQRLLAHYKKDTVRFDILQEAAKMSFMSGDYEEAKSYYERSLRTMKMYGMDLFKHEYLRIAMTYDKTGDKEKAKEFAEAFREYAEGDLTMYKDLHLSAYYAYKGETAKAVALFSKFANEQDNFLYWLLLMDQDACVEDLRKHPDFKASMKKIEQKYWKKHKELKERWGSEIENL